MTRYRNFMVALINPRGLHHFNERYCDHFGTTYLNGLHLLLVLWLRISRLRMYCMSGDICFSPWHRYTQQSARISKCRIWLCFAQWPSLCCAQLPGVLGRWRTGNSNQNFSGVQASSIRSAIGHIWPQRRASHFFCESHRSYIEEAQKKR